MPCKLHARSRDVFTTSPKEVLEAKISALVPADDAEGNLKKLLSRPRQLDKL